MSWRSDRRREDKNFVIPTYHGKCADELIDSHWKAKDMKIQGEHEVFYRLILKVLDEIIVPEPESKEDEETVARVMRDIREYEKWKTDSTWIDLLSFEDSQDWASESKIYISTLGEIDLAPERHRYLKATGMPPVRYLRGRVCLDDLKGKAVQMRDGTELWQCAGVRARIYECSHPDRIWQECVYDCFNGGDRCPYLRGPVYTRNMGVMDPSMYFKLRNIAHRHLTRLKTKIEQELWGSVASNYQADQIRAILGSAMPGRENPPEEVDSDEMEARSEEGSGEL